MLEANVQEEIVEQIAGIITYGNGAPVGWTPVTSKGKMCHANQGQRLAFRFDGPGDVVQAVMLIGPTRNSTPQSPFEQPNPVALTRYSQPDQETNYFMTPPVNVKKGTWGFSISFMTEVDGTKDSVFYFLPDPELAVGSIGAE